MRSAEIDRELSKDCGHGLTETSAQDPNHSVDTIRGTGAIHGDRTDTGNKGGHGIEQNGDNQEQHGLEGTYGLKGGQGLKGNHSPRDSQLEDGRQDMDGTGLNKSGWPHQAASEGVEPQSRQASPGRPGRLSSTRLNSAHITSTHITSAHTSSMRLSSTSSRFPSPINSRNSSHQDFSFDSSHNNNLDQEVPLSRLYTKRTHPESNNCKIISHIQARPPIFFPIRASFIMSTTRYEPEGLVRRSLRGLAAQKKRRAQEDLGGKDLGGKDLGGKDLGSKDLGGEDLGGEDLGGEDLGAQEHHAAGNTVNTGRITKTSAKAKGKAKAKAKKALTEEERREQRKYRNMADRYYTKENKVAFQCLQEAMKEFMPHDLRGQLEQQAKAKFEAQMRAEISNDLNPTEMAAFFEKKSSSKDGGAYTYTFNTCKTSVQDSEQNRPPADKPEKRSEHSFVYFLFSSTSTEGLGPINIIQRATRLPGCFLTRAEANAKLDRVTQYDKFEGGMAAVSRRHVYEDTPSKLLKVELTLNTGEERVLWVERRLVNLDRDLTRRERGLKKWSATRPKLQHYIVECEFMTRDAATESPSLLQDLDLEEDELMRDEDDSEDENEDEDASEDESSSASSSAAPPPSELTTATATTKGHSKYYSSGGGRDVKLDRLPLATFTDRALANEHAGDLFLRHSAVNSAIRSPLDDFWWANHAVPIHKNAEHAAEGNSVGLYVAELETFDMKARLGFDWMRVAVYAVDDVTGPLNI